MNPEKQSPPSIVADREWRKASAVRTTLNVPIVKFADFVGVPKPERTKARIANLTCRVVSSPTADRSAQNIAGWSSYLPADCVAVMVSLGWDHTT